MPNDITAQAADGTLHVFPSGTDPSVIDAAMKRYVATSTPGAMQSKPGGPVFGGRLATSTGQDEGTLAKVARGTVLGAASGAGISETPTPVRDTLKNLFSSWLSSDPETMARNAPPVKMASGMVEGFGKATEAANPLLDNFFRWLSNKTGGRQFDYRPVDPEQTAHDLAAFGTQLAMMKGGKEATEMESGLAGAGKGAREVIGEGKFKATNLAYQHANAMNTASHFKAVADAVHTDAQQAMSQVLARVDEAHPEGAFSKAEIQDKLGAAVGELVQVPEKLPPSLSRILKVEKPSGMTGPGSAEVGNFINRLKSGGLSDADIMQTLQGQGFSRTEIAAAMGGGTEDALTAEQLKQMRSDIGQDLARYGDKGVIGAGLKKSYGVLSKELRGAAATAGVESEWLDANNRYSQYAQDFTRKGAPLRRVLEGTTASGVMEPLSGPFRQQILDTMQKYRDAGFNVDMDFINREIGRYGAAKKTLRMAEPGKWDLILAGLSPKAAALRQGVPRMAGSPTALDMVFGKGAEMPPSKVYPSKAAAMAASREIPQGRPSLFEDAMEQARRRAPGESPAVKSIRRKMGGDTEKKFRAMDKLRKKAEEEE